MHRRDKILHPKKKKRDKITSTKISLTKIELNVD